MSVKFFYCPVCGNVIVKVDDSGVMPVCCGNPMRELKPNELDAESETGEKHVPMVSLTDGGGFKVEIGSLPHPAIPEHHICFVVLETENGFEIRYLNPTEPAVASFCKCQDKPTAVYGYCNIHGLWKTTKLPTEPEKKLACCFRKLTKRGEC